VLFLSQPLQGNSKAIIVHYVTPHRLIGVTQTQQVIHININIPLIYFATMIQVNALIIDYLMCVIYCIVAYVYGEYPEDVERISSSSISISEIVVWLCSENTG